MKPKKIMRQKATLWVQRIQKKRQTRCGKKSHLQPPRQLRAVFFFAFLGWNELAALCTCHARELLSAGEGWDVLLRSLVGMSGGKRAVMRELPFRQLTYEQWKKPGCLGYIGDEILPSYIGIIINHYFRIPINQPGWLMKSRTFPFGAPRVTTWGVGSTPDGFRFNRHSFWVF